MSRHGHYVILVIEPEKTNPQQRPGGQIEALVCFRETEAIHCPDALRFWQLSKVLHRQHQRHRRSNDLRDTAVDYSQIGS